MTRWVVALGCALSVIAVGATAAAFDDKPTRGTFEFKLGPYSPQVDAEFGDVGPYAQFFGDRSMLYAEVEYDYHLWQGFGTLAVAGHLGYGRVSAPVVDQDGEVIDSEERTALRILPLRASLVYRFDYGLKNYNIPLVPVAKGGLNYYFWRIIDPGGDTPETEGRSASGGMFGFQATLGLHFLLNILDPRRAAALHMHWGIRKTYIFAEYTFSRTGIFSQDAINLSANHWALGLAFEF